MFAALGLMPIILLIVVVMVVVAVLSHAAAKKRREELAALAQSLGFSFDPAKDSRHDDQYAQFELFRQGHSRVALNTMRGEIKVDGRRYSIKMGDFRYRVTSSNGKSSNTTTYRLSYIIASMPFDGVPGLLIRREHMLDKLASAIGFADIDFESAEFSRRYLVKSPDRRFAYDVVDPRMIEFLLDGDPPTIEIERGCCLIHRTRRRWTSLQFRQNLGWLSAFFDRWPDHLTRSLDDRGAGV